LTHAEKKLTRRRFVTSIGAGVVGLAVGLATGSQLLTRPERVIERIVTQPAVITTVEKTVTATQYSTTTVTQTPPATKPVKLRVGTAVLHDFVLAAPNLIALEKGFFAKHGLDVEYIPFPGGARAAAALAADEVDVVGAGIDFWVLKDREVDVRAIAAMNEGIHMTLVVAKDVQKLEDLKGAAIGITSPGSTTWAFALAIADVMGWEVDKDVKIVALGGFDAQIAALRRGETKAFVWGDFGTVAEALGVGKVLFTLDKVIPGFWQDELIYAKHEFIKKNPAALHELILAYMEAWRYMRLHPDDVAAIVAKKTEAPLEAIKQIIKLVGPKISVDGRIYLKAIKDMPNFLYKKGIIKKVLSPEEYIVRGFAPVIED